MIRTRTSRFGALLHPLPLLSSILLAAGSIACQGETLDTNARQQNLDDVTVPATGMSLVVVDEAADWQRVADAIDELDGDVFHVQPPRMIVARVAPGSDDVLGMLGMTHRFDGAVDADALPDATVAETRFATVFSNRYYPNELPPVLRNALAEASIPSPVLDEGEPLEEAGPPAALKADTLAGDVDAEAFVYVPYASGTVVVSIWLPESNGTSEASTENWNEAMILQTYEKVQTALEAIKRHGPAANLRFVLHLESSPDNGGLPGTIDCNWEFGKQANWGNWAAKERVVAEMLSRLLGREVTASDTWTANRDYLNDLRDRYNADSAFYVMVAANGNGTAGLRAHASFHGPSTTLSSSNGWNVFMHEFGHIFGARDEYCPDACNSPTSMAGYLGMINANARFREGDAGGINGGKGEDQPSLMMYNVVNEVNGYVRGAWGWLDTDGDGIFDVVDTFPNTEVEARLEGDGDILRVTGLITDVPETRWAGTEFSANRIRTLEYRFADVVDSPWFALELTGRTRGREAVDAILGDLPVGTHTIELRAINSVGNVEPTPQTVTVFVDGADNAAPYLRLSTDARTGSTASPFALTADTLDLDGEDVQVRFDLDGDGSYDTPFGDARTATASFAKAGIYTVGAQAQDADGARTEATVELLVARDNTAPRATIAGIASPIHGSASLPMTFAVGEAVDREGGPLEYNWIAELATMTTEHRVETGFSPGNTTFETLFETPLGLVTHPIDLTAGDEDLRYQQVFDIERIGDHVLVMALGGHGLVFVDIADRKAPRVLSRLSLGAVARSLRVNGERLYVLGGTMTVVDISDLTAPVEIEQLVQVKKVRASRNRDAVDIDENWGAWHGHYAPWDEPIRDLTVRVVIDHPDPSELLIELFPPKSLGLKSIVLRDGEPGPGGKRTYVFNKHNSPDIAALEGVFATDNWDVRVTDKVANKVVGQLVRSRLKFRTRHRAIPVLPGARDIVGVVHGDYVVVAGEGLQILDMYWEDWAYEVDTITGTGFLGATIVDDTVVVLSPLEREMDDEKLAIDPSIDGDLDADSLHGYGFGYEPDTRGLYAVSLRYPFWPQVVRVESDVAASQLVGVGDRFYLRSARDTGPKPELPKALIPMGVSGETTTVGDLSAFATGADYVLGSFDGVVSHNAFGDDSTIWTVGAAGRIQELDVSSPANVRIVRELNNPPGWNMMHMGGSEVLFPNSVWSTYANLEDTSSTVSRVYRITLETRDASGAIGRTTRAVHLVPYNHAPAIDSMEVVAGSTDRDEWQLRVLSTDGDGAPVWDPNLLIRADLDGDGAFDSRWTYANSRDGALFFTEFANTGDYTLRFQVRDGFWATATRAFDVTVNPWTPVACSDDAACAPGEFCHFADTDSCGADGAVGVCERPNWDCSKELAPVCGCDGRTYDNPCLAAANRTSVDYEGACEVTYCGGRTGNTCPDDQYCAWDVEDACGAFDAPGVCTFMPQICLFPQPGQEVCGCDGTTYSGACQAAQAGVSVQSEGACDAPEDCRDTGCEDDGVCMFCWAGFVCMPEGVTC